MKKDDAALAALVEGASKRASGGWDTMLTKEREEVSQYRDGLLPKPLHRGDSKYVSTDVYDGVESMKAQLLETFSGNRQPVQFAPQGSEDAQHATDATEYVNYAVMRQNDGFRLMQDAIDDGLMNRVAVAKCWWDERSEEVEQTVEGLSFDEFYSLVASKPEAEIRDTEIDPEGRVVTRATLVETRDASQVRIELIPPEEFGISRLAKSAGDAEIVFHRTRCTAADLVAMGVDPKKLDELKDENGNWELQSGDIQIRHAETDDGIGDDSWDRDDKDKTRRIEVTEAYMRLDLDGSVKLWRLLVAGGKLLKKDAVRRLPFVFFVPLPKPHAFWGANFAKKLVPIQNARTLLTRSIINHALITNNPRTGVVKGGLINPKELTENRLGGLVNLTRPDALVPIVQTGLNPFVFQTIEQVNSDKEQVTGVSRLSQGLNKDAISKQNSAEMVQNLAGMSQTRQKVTARNFAEFLKALYLEVYRLVVENEQAERIIEVAGSWKTVDPTTWPDRKDVIAEVNVGYGEADKEAQKWTAVDTYMRQDAQLAPVYTSDRRYFVLTQILKAMGIKNVDSVMADPKTIKPPEPSPQDQAQLAIAQAEAEVKMAQAQSAKAQAQSQLQKIQLQAEVERAELQLKMAELAEKKREFDLKLALDREKMASEERLADRATDVRAISSLNS